MKMLHVGHHVKVTADAVKTFVPGEGFTPVPKGSYGVITVRNVDRNPLRQGRGQQRTIRYKVSLDDGTVAWFKPGQLIRHRVPE